MKSVQNWKEHNTRVVVLYQQGWYSEAASTGEETLTLAEDIFGPNHLNTAESLSNLALIYYAQAKDAERAIFEQTLETRGEKTPRSDSPEKVQSLNRLVLLNLSKSKYSRAETLLDRALKIKKEDLGSDHPDVLQLIGNLAALYSSQGKYAAAESLLRSVRSLNTNSLRSNDLASDDWTSRDFAKEYANREHMRYGCHFPVKILKDGLDSPMGGVTENLGQAGAFIKTKDVLAFETDDQVSVYIFIPSLFSPKYNAVGMQGTGVITRVDEKNRGIAIRFKTNFKQFERVGGIEVPEKARYKRLVNYLSDLENKGETEFMEKHPSNFFVEKDKMILDKDVIFKFGTEQPDDLIS